jgi:hypothetical protein
MSDLKLFRISSGRATEIGGSAAALEKSLQVLIEKNLETFLGVRLLGHVDKLLNQIRTAAILMKPR